MESRKIYLVFGVLLLVFAVLLLSSPFIYYKLFLYNPSVPALPPSLPYLTPNFVGRENETIDLTSLLQYTNDAPRIISITGGPGFGKSTLAISMGHELQEEGVDVVYVDMNEASSKHALAEKVVTSYKRLVSARNVTLGDLYQWSKDLRHPTLLILDNCDKQFHTNKDDLQIAVKRLITQSSFKTLKVLTTSRRQVMYVSSLKHHIFVIKELSTSNACKLLLGITNSLNATTCRDLANLTGNVPLALHVVGALFSMPIAPAPQQVISEMIENLIGTLSPEDLQTEDRVNVSIMLSYQYLQADQQKIGRYLSYFPGSFDKDAAYSIIKSCVLPNKNLAGISLDLLVRRSLLDYDKRYVFHKLIREFFKNMSSLKESWEFEMCFLDHYASSLERMTEMDFSKALGEYYIDKHNFKHFFDLLSAKFRDKNLNAKTAETIINIADIIDNFMNKIENEFTLLRDFSADLLSFLKLIKGSFNEDEFVRLYSSFAVNFMMMEGALYSTKDTAILIESIEKHRWIFEKHGELVSPELYVKFYSTLATYYEEIENHERAKECHKKVLQRENALNECHDSCNNLELAKAFSFKQDYKSSTYYCNRELETMRILPSQNLDVIQSTKTLIELFNIYLSNNNNHGVDQVTTKLIEIVQSHLLKFHPAFFICELHTIIKVVDVLQSVNKKTESENILAHLKQTRYSMQNCEMTVIELMTTLMKENKYDKVILVGDIISLADIIDVHRVIHFMGYSYYQLGRYTESSSFYSIIANSTKPMNIAKSLAYLQLMRMGSLKYIHHFPSLLWYNTQYAYTLFWLCISYQYDDFLASDITTARTATANVGSSEDNSQYYSVFLNIIYYMYVYFKLLVIMITPLILCCFSYLIVCWCGKKQHLSVYAYMYLPPVLLLSWCILNITVETFSMCITHELNLE